MVVKEKSHNGMREGDGDTSRMSAIAIDNEFHNGGGVGRMRSKIRKLSG